MKALKHFSIHIALFGIAVASLGLTSCLSKKSDKKIQVAALMKNIKKGGFDEAYLNALKAKAESENVELIVYTCNYDATIQLDQIKNMLTQGIKYFVFFPVDTGITEQFTKLIASRGGAAVFSNTVPTVEALKTSKTMFYVASPETSAGEYQAQMLDEYFRAHPQKVNGKSINLAIFDGEYGHPGQVYRRQGVLDGLEKLGYRVNITCEDTAKWNATTAEHIMDTWVEGIKPGAKLPFDAVVCNSDEMAIGAIASLVKNGFVDDPASPIRDTDGDGIILKVPVLGVDATEKGKKSLSEQKLYATVLQDAKVQAETAMELILQCAKKGDAQGYVSENGIKAATAVTKEDPITDKAILSQCYPVPFVPVKR